MERLVLLGLTPEKPVYPYKWKARQKRRVISKICPYRNPFPSLPRLSSFIIGSSHLSSTVLQYQTTALWFRMI